MKTLSIIVPFYHGNRYIGNILNNIKDISAKLKKKVRIELIIVNDSPDEEVVIQCGCSDIEIKIVNNESNVGIQKTRINGLGYATSSWIIFLDQDDELCVNGIVKEIDLIDDNVDLIIGNGIYEKSGKSHKIYSNILSMKINLIERNFVYVRNLIVSPGQCLIRKKSIPEEWCKHVLHHNGSDDWLLWLLMFNKTINIKYCSSICYKHKNSGNNYSYNLALMNKSNMEMCQILERCNYPKDQLNILKKAIEFKYCKDVRKIKIKDYLKNMNLVFANILYKFTI